MFDGKMTINRFDYNVGEGFSDPSFVGQDVDVEVSLKPRSRPPRCRGGHCSDLQRAPHPFAQARPAIRRSAAAERASPKSNAEVLEGAASRPKRMPGAGNSLQNSATSALIARALASSAAAATARSIHAAILGISLSGMPRDVTDGVPMRIPLGSNGLRGSNGTVL